MRSLPCVLSMLTSIWAVSDAQTRPCYFLKDLKHAYFNPENCNQMRGQVYSSCTIGDTQEFNILSCTNKKCNGSFHEGCILREKLLHLNMQGLHWRKPVPSAEEFKRRLVLECPLCSVAFERQLGNILLHNFAVNGVEGSEALLEFYSLFVFPTLFGILYDENITSSRYEEIYFKLCTRKYMELSGLRYVIADALLLKKIPLANRENEIYETLQKILEHDCLKSSPSHYVHSHYFYYSLFMLYFTTETAVEEDLIFIDNVLKIIENRPRRLQATAYRSLFTAFFESKLNSKNIYAIVEHFAFSPLAKFLQYAGQHKLNEVKDINTEIIAEILLKNIKTKRWFVQGYEEAALTYTFIFIERIESFGDNGHRSFIEGLAKHIVSLSPQRTYKGVVVTGSKTLKLFMVDMIRTKTKKPTLVKQIANMIVSSDGYSWFFYDFALCEYIKRFGNKLNLHEHPTMFIEIVKEENKQNSKKITYTWLKKYFEDARFKSEKLMLNIVDLLCNSTKDLPENCTKNFFENHAKNLLENYKKVKKYTHTVQKIPVVNEYLNCISSCLNPEDSVNKIEMDLIGLFLRHIHDRSAFKKCFDRAVQGQSDENIKYLVKGIKKHSKFATCLDASFVTY
ncbi:hypothetical protein ENBRE01_0061 [Enteropsectra breve]|nr:hypothetical protein ENBRE01_0061 [Enteropsectra breve]